MTINIIKELEKLSKQYKVKLYFDYNLGFFGACEYWNNKIYLIIQSGILKSEYLSVFYHELGHIYCYKNDIWPNYHWRRKKQWDINKWKLTALKAEIWVDKWGERQFKQYYPNLVYLQSYRTKEDKEWFRQYNKHIFQ